MNSLTDHFALTAIPFRKIPPCTAFASVDLRTVMRRLEGLELLGGIALCVGEAGAGKTYAVEAWARSLDPRAATTRWVDDPATTSFGFFRRLARAFGLQPLHNTQALANELPQRHPRPLPGPRDAPDRGRGRSTASTRRGS